MEHAKPLVEQFFAWVDERLANQGLLPSNEDLGIDTVSPATNNWAG